MRRVFMTNYEGGKGGGARPELIRPASLLQTSENEPCA